MEISTIWHGLNLSSDDGNFSADDVKRGMIPLNSDFKCGACGKWQSVAQAGGYAAPCIRCGDQPEARK